MHYVQDIRLLTSSSEDATDVTFKADTGVPIKSRAVDTMGVLANGTDGETRVVAMERAYYVPNQPHSPISVRQLTRDFFNSTWADTDRITHQYIDLVRELLWSVTPNPEGHVDTYGVYRHLRYHDSYEERFACFSARKQIGYQSCQRADSPIVCTSGIIALHVANGYLFQTWYVTGCYK